MLKKTAPLFLTVVSVLATFISNSQNLIWAKSIGGIGEDIVTSIDVDINSNIYVCGSFTNTVDFDPGPGTATISAGLTRDVFISKYDNQGNFVWVKQIIGAAYYGVECYFIDLDESGDFLITGSFQSTVDFDPGPGVKYLTAKMNTAGDKDVFICKYDKNGNLKWAKSFYGSRGEGYCVKTDSNKNVYTTGSFSGRGNFDPGAGTFTLAPRNFDNDIFISKLDSSGNFVWAKGFGSESAYDYARSLTIGPNNDLYCTGIFAGNNVDFDPGSNTFYLSSSTQNYDIYFSRFTLEGDFVWAKKIGGIKSDYVSAIQVDNYGELYICGKFSRVVDFDPGPGTTNLLGNGGIDSLDAFIAKYNTAGELKWVNKIGGPDSLEYIRSLVLDKNRDIYVCGTYEGITDFDPSATTYDIVSQGMTDMFTAKYLNNGDLSWVKTAGGPQNDYGASVCIDNAGNVYSTGAFLQNIIYNPPSNSNYFSSGKQDVLLLNYSNIVGLKDNRTVEKAVTIFPNPVSNKIRINPPCDASVQLVNLQGKVIGSWKTNTVSSEIDVTEINEGLYFVKIIVGNNYVVEKINVLK